MYRHVPVTTDNDSRNKDSPSSPSLAKLLKTDTTTTTADVATSKQQHFDGGGDSGGGGGSGGRRSDPMDDGRDSWGSISKLLHHRYNSGTNSCTAEGTGESLYRRRVYDSMALLFYGNGGHTW